MHNYLQSEAWITGPEQRYYLIGSMSWIQLWTMGYERFIFYCKQNAIRKQSKKNWRRFQIKNNRMTSDRIMQWQFL